MQVHSPMRHYIDPHNVAPHRIEKKGKPSYDIPLSFIRKDRINDTPEKEKETASIPYFLHETVL